MMLSALLSLLACADEGGGLGGAGQAYEAPVEESLTGDDVYPGAPDDILVVVIDTLRRDVLGYMGDPCGASPNLDALAAGGVVLEQVIAPRGLTYPTVATLLTGLQPRDHGIWEQDQLPAGSFRTWPELADEEREVAVFAANGCPVYEGILGLDTYSCPSEDLAGQDEGPIRDEQLVGELERWLAETAEHPRVAILHLLTPHEPYSEHQPALDGLLDACPSEARWDVGTQYGEVLADGLSEAERDWLLRVYQSALVYEDGLIGGLVDALRAEDFFDDGLLVVGSDHGEDLLGHPEMLYEEHALAPWTSVFATSWIVYAPAFVRPGRREQVLCAADLGATFHELLGGEIPGPDGLGLWDAISGGGDIPERACAGEITEHIAGLVTDRWHLVANPGRLSFDRNVLGVPTTLSPPEWSLYDREADPLELRDIAGEEPAVVRSLWEQLCADVLDRDYDYRGDPEPSAVREACEGL